MADGELSEDELEEVAGGIGTLLALLLIGLGTAGAIGGIITGNMLGW